MPETLLLSGKESVTFFLHPNQSREVSFVPLAGRVKVTSAAAAEDVAPSGPPHPDPLDQIDIPLEGKIQMELFSPGSAQPVATKVTQSSEASIPLEALTFTVAPNQAGKTWKCRFKNIGSKKVRGFGAVEFIEREVAVTTTAIPLRVLNNAFRAFLEALGLNIRLDQNGSFIDFSEDLKRHSKGQLKRIEFTVPHAKDIRSQGFSVIATASDGKPAVLIMASFEESGKEIDVPRFPDADLENISLNVILELRAHTDLSGRRVITPLASVRTDIRLKGGVVADIVKETVVDVNKEVKSRLESRLNSSAVVRFVGDFLTEGIMELVKRGDVFHDISVDGLNFAVKHFSPDSSSRRSIVAEPSEMAPPAIPATGPAAGPAVDSPRNLQSAENLKKIDHIVVLMMENRSFDHMFGYLKAQEKRTDVDGLNGTESNSIPGVVAHVRPLREFLSGPTRFPISPEHGLDEVESQIANGKMSGFLKSFIGKAPTADPDLIMGFNTKDEVPVYHFLAENFAICDAWFASHPGPTWPNRFCTLTGRTPTLKNFSLGDPQIGYVTLPTVFDFLPRDFWVYYEQDIAFLRIFDRFRLDDRNVIPFGDTKEGFFARAKAGTLPPITFIDPNFSDVGPAGTANDDLPPADISRGQQLVSLIYNALVSSPQWSKTLFIITYDEHGGFYDHAAPPGTESYKGVPINVAKVHPQGKAFYGVRVPTIVISPWVTKGRVEKTVFDHTSILRTIMLKFQEQRFPEPGPRVTEANDLGSLLTRDQPRLNAPTVKADGVTGAEASPAPAKLSRSDFHVVMRYFPLPPKAHPF